MYLLYTPSLMCLYEGRLFGFGLVEIVEEQLKRVSNWISRFKTSKARAERVSGGFSAKLLFPIVSLKAVCFYRPLYFNAFQGLPARGWVDCRKIWLPGLNLAAVQWHYTVLYWPYHSTFIDFVNTRLNETVQNLFLLYYSRIEFRFIYFNKLIGRR